MMDGEITKALNAPLDPTLVKIHPQTKARYLDGKHYIETANRIFGYGRWQFRILDAPTRATEGNRNSGKHYALWTVMGELNAAGATFIDLGTCEQNGEGPEATDMAMKGSVTDALKRCLRNFGDQFGLVLYDKELSYQDMADEFHDYQAKGTAPATATFRQRVDPETGEIHATAQAGGSAVSTHERPAGQSTGPNPGEMKAIQSWVTTNGGWTNAAILDALDTSAAAIGEHGPEVAIDAWWAAQDKPSVPAFKQAVQAAAKKLGGAA